MALNEALQGGPQAPGFVEFLTNARYAAPTVLLVTYGRTAGIDARGAIRQGTLRRDLRPCP
jgi:hypothetical protein